jgi:hypothetical protein
MDVAMDEETKLIPEKYDYGSPSLAGNTEDMTDSDEADPHRIHREGSLYNVNPSNMWMSARQLRSKPSMILLDDYEKVPTELSDNMKFVTDPTLDTGEPGLLYYSEDAFYDQNHSPEYALTLNEDIYQRLFNEIFTAKQVPCGLYFCCHGGDGAHTGVSHDDYVDIRVAWSIMSVVLVAMACIEIMA